VYLKRSEGKFLEFLHIFETRNEVIKRVPVAKKEISQE
jgi:hypothetical protein